MNVFAGQGDPAKSIALLWRDPGASSRSGPGPKPGLTIDAIVDAAIAVADADTMAGLSMRAVADRLGCSSMTLYTYVPGKAELLDLMYDGVHAELTHAHGHTEDWRRGLTSWAEELREFYLRHPWVLQVSYARPVLGPHEQAVLENIAAIVAETGLAAPVRRGIVNLLFTYVRGSAQTAAEALQTEAATQVADQDWWHARTTELAKVAPDFAGRFPESMRLNDDPAPSWHDQIEQTFASGLAVLLDGIEAGMHR